MIDFSHVAAMFDPAMLAHVCTTDDFAPWADRTDLGSGRYYWHRDNGAPVLAVAHLDHVQDDASCSVVDTAAGPLAISGALDDRLGAYVILDLLPKLGLAVDLLLTTDEESGRSTARDFALAVDDPPWNWAIEFDRGGTDVVLYQYETPELVELVRRSGARVGTGSYSDVVDLDTLGIAGLNWGVGYQDYHSPRSHAWLYDTFRMVAHFERFYLENADTLLEHDSDAASWLNYEDEAWTEADCGHMVDLADPRDSAAWCGSLVCAVCADELGIAAI